MSHDVFATIRRVFAHIKLEKRLDRVRVVDADPGESHVRADESLEFSRRNFPKSLKPRHLATPKLLYGIITFRLRVAINRRFLVAHAEKRGLENADEFLGDNIRKKPEKAGDQ